MPTSLGAGCGRAEGRPKKCRPLPMVTLIMSKFPLVGAESKLVKLGTLEPMKGPRLDAARRASLQSRGELADAFAANVRPIIKRYRRTASPVCGIARALAARGVKTARGGDWSDVQVAAILRR